MRNFVEFLSATIIAVALIAIIVIIFLGSELDLSVITRISFVVDCLVLILLGSIGTLSVKIYDGLEKKVSG